MVRPQQVPKNWSLSAVDFTNKLIQRKPANRLGKEGINELKGHEWFASFNWEQLLSRKMRSPFKPLSLEQID